MKKYEEYYVGLDMGTGSVGWAVTDPSYNIIKRHGKEKLKEVLDKLHEEYEFSKIQEILKENLDNSVAFLENIYNSTNS